MCVCVCVCVNVCVYEPHLSRNCRMVVQVLLVCPPASLK